MAKGKINLLHIGTAGWAVSREHAEHFPAAGSHLERYSQTLGCVEINSSFHRSHRRSTWERWAASTPAGFRFAVKVPKSITHMAKLHNAGALLLAFMQEVSGLNAGDEPKLGPLLVQLPPKLAFDAGVVREFLQTLRELHTGEVAVEPRHGSWFTAEADRLLREFGAARVAADPPKGSPLAAEPAGDPSLRYWRLHGAPRTYYSNYADTALDDYAKRLRVDRKRLPNSDVWVIFDNTAVRHATINALALSKLLSA